MQLVQVEREEFTRDIKLKDFLVLKLEKKWEKFTFGILKKVKKLLLEVNHLKGVFKCARGNLKRIENYEGLNLEKLLLVDIGDDIDDQSSHDQTQDHITLVLLCLADKSCIEPQIDEILTSINELVDSKDDKSGAIKYREFQRDDLLIMHACIYTPWTRKQHQEWTRHWPMSFYGGNRERQAQLNQEQTLISLAHMKSLSSSLPQASGDHVTSSGCFGSEVVEAFLVDPKSKSILLRVVLNPSISSQRHPLDHASMLLIHGLASQTHTANSESSSKRKSKEDQYYCTNLHLYITHEPCMMCSMALVHSRIGMVFYGKRDGLYGALGSAYKIHICQSLNHHFQVFRLEDGYKNIN